MANSTENRLINQAQFRNLGKHFDDWYVDRDTRNLKEAIQILQGELDDINKNFNTKAMRKIQKNARRADVDDTGVNMFLSRMGDVPIDRFQDVLDVANGTKTAQAKDDAADGDTPDDKGTSPDDASNHGDDDSHDDSSSTDDDDPDDNQSGDDSSLSSDDDKGQDSNDHDNLDFLNR